MIVTIPVVIPITTTAVLVLAINNVACVPVLLLPFRNLGSGNGTFVLGCGIDLSSCGTVMVECCGKFWLRPLSQDLFSARVLVQTTVRLPFQNGRTKWAFGNGKRHLSYHSISKQP